jgi:ParB/RepB/Spo0J family partition protein
MSKIDLRAIKVANIRPGNIALRAYNPEDKQFQELKDSIKAEGILNAISVRAQTDAETKEEFYELIDGRQRFSAAKELGMEEVPAQILDKDDQEVMIAQIIGNAQRVETKPMEYQQQLVKVLLANPTMTEADLATTLHKSPQWIGSILKLEDLHESIKPLVNEGKIVLANAFALAKIKPAEEQLRYLNEAQTQASSEFTGPVLQRAKELRDARRAGKGSSEAKFTPIPHMRKLNDVKAEIEAPSVATEMVSRYREEYKISDVESAKQGFILGVKWAAQVDPVTVAQKEAEFNANKAAAEEAAKKRKQEREAKKAQEAQANTDKAHANAGAGEPVPAVL